MTTEEQDYLVLRLNLESFKNPELKPYQVTALIGFIEILLKNNHPKVLEKVGYDLHKAKKSFDCRVIAAEKILKLIEGNHE